RHHNNIHCRDHQNIPLTTTTESKPPPECNKQAAPPTPSTTGKTCVPASA
ncbi:hypothetical protein A2U01_0082808, partial [Trifolium medium]|nr:hypothetical protein [Trifolium medium]